MATTQASHDVEQGEQYHSYITVLSSARDRDDTALVLGQEGERWVSTGSNTRTRYSQKAVVELPKPMPAGEVLEWLSSTLRGNRVLMHHFDESLIERHARSGGEDGGAGS